MVAKHKGRKGRELRDHPRISDSICNKKFVTFSIVFKSDSECVNWLLALLKPMSI